MSDLSMLVNFDFSFRKIKQNLLKQINKFKKKIIFLKFRLSPFFI